MHHIREDKGWLRVNDQGVKHYWFVKGWDGVYQALCGKQNVPYMLEIAGHLPQCHICKSIRLYEQDKTHEFRTTSNSGQ